MNATRVHLAVAGFVGALGVAALARGAHAEGFNGLFVGIMLLVHAPAIAVVSLARKLGQLAPRLAQASVAALALGPVLFAFAVTFRRLLPDGAGVLAPVSGGLTVLGWALFALAAGLGSGRTESGR